MATGYTNTITCPYNKSHNILRERFQTHLVKCAKSYPDIKLKKCPFNSTHMLPEVELEDHVITCEDRANFDLYRYTIAPTVGNEGSGRCAQPGPRLVSLPTDGENWDNEDVHTYNPQDYVERAPVIRQLNVAPPSERRAFRESERLRHNQMNR